MTPEELQAVLAAQDAKVATLVKSAVVEALAAKSAEAEAAEANAEPKTEVEVAPTFTGDVNDPQALADYEASLKGFEMRKSISEGNLTSEDIAKMRKSLMENTSELAEEAGVEAEDSDEVRGLKVRLFKAQKSTNAPERKQAVEDEDVLVKAAETEGLEIAKLMNEAMGNGGVSASGMRVVNG